MTPTARRATRARAQAARAVAALLWLAIVPAVGCGYHPIRGAHPASGRSATPLRILPVTGAGSDLDAQADVQWALADALRQQPVFIDAGRQSDVKAAGTVLRLSVHIARAGTRLSPLTEPALRAAMYEAEIVLEGRCTDGAGQVCWRGAESARVRYLSTPGGVETLDGAGRRALVDAAAVAAERLLEAFAWALRSGEAVFLQQPV